MSQLSARLYRDSMKVQESFAIELNSRPQADVGADQLHTRLTAIIGRGAADLNCMLVNAASDGNCKILAATQRRGVTQPLCCEEPPNYMTIGPSI
jgi:hypothetical protein